MSPIDIFFRVPVACPSASRSLLDLRNGHVDVSNLGFQTLQIGWYYQLIIII